MQMLRLAPPQEEQLLLVRKKHLRNLRELYNDRQRMNLQVSRPGSFQPCPGAVLCLSLSLPACKLLWKMHPAVDCQHCH